MSEHSRLSSSSSSVSSAMKSVLFFLVLCLLINSSSQAHILTLRSESTPKCKVYSKPSVHQAMDRICEMCHEMFSHQKPNMRADCRTKCFRNDQFRSCLEMFSANPHPIEEKRTY